MDREPFLLWEKYNILIPCIYKSIVRSFLFAGVFYLALNYG